MPELAEVETVRRGLEKVLVGKRITGCKVHIAKLIEAPITDIDEFEKKVIGRRFENVRRRGKHLIFGLDNGYAVMAHLMMRGHMRIVAPGILGESRYLGVVFELEDGYQCRYYDVWGWGEFRLVRDLIEEHARHIPALGRMGREPLDDGFDGKHLQQAAGNRRTSIKAALLDQAVVAGIGNIYADESLFRAGVRPDRRVGELDEREWNRLAESIIEVLADAVAKGGAASDEFVGPDGAPGGYVPLVYGRGGQACTKCSSPLVRGKIAGRGTVYCPKCQS